MRSLAPILLLGLSTMALAQLSPEEKREVQDRLHAFYARTMDASVMLRRVPKYDVLRHRWAEPGELLAPKKKSKNPLINLAGEKADPRFQKFYCDKVLSKHFPKLKCHDEWAEVEGNDRVEDLVESWMPQDRLATSLDQMPTKGATSIDLWSDDYWRMKWGLTSYRYSGYDKDHPPKTYHEAVESYSQPDDWQAIMGLPIAEIAHRVVSWSPAEKYDLSVGDTSFTLTNEQKGEGASQIEHGDVPNWYGLCHGWAAASVMAPKPTRTARLTGPNGLTVEWYPNDVRAMATLAWSNGAGEANFIGGRCKIKDPKTYPNGRIIAQDCFDTNPATFHSALTNLIGRQKQTFILDSTFDYEVWNEAVRDYELTYFNPLDPDQQSDNWQDVAVDYDDTFKAQDRFQHPLTRGTRENGRYDDHGIAKIVGVIATINYMTENTPPDFGPTPQQDIVREVTYTYDLELHREGGRLVPKGGEWHENSHPDFLWLPKKDSFASSDADYERIEFTGTTPPDDSVTELASYASDNAAMPLCRVVKELFRQSSGRDGYRCPDTK